MPWTPCANIPSSIPAYLKALQRLREKSSINSCLVALSQQRILFVESHIYNYILSSCLPYARLVIRNHQTHLSVRTSLCSCYDDVHPHDQWLVKLVLRLDQLLSWTPNSFVLQPASYLPRLTNASPFVRNIPPSRHRISSIPVPEQLIITTIKEVLYFWLDIPYNREAEYRAAMVDIFHGCLGAGSLILSSVWSLCHKVPRWIYTPPSVRSQGDDPLFLFSEIVKILPVAFPNTAPYHSLKSLWQKYELFCTSCSSKNNQLTIVRNPITFHGIGSDIANTKIEIFKTFLLDCWRFVGKRLPHDHQCFLRLHTRTDFFLPLREHAPCRVNFTRSVNGHFLQTPKGLFNLLVFRVLMYNSDAARNEVFNFDLESLNAFRVQHDNANNTKYYYNNNAYGAFSPRRQDHELMKRYWNLCSRVWPKFIADNKGSMYLFYCC